MWAPNIWGIFLLPLPSFLCSKLSLGIHLSPLSGETTLFLNAPFEYRNKDCKEN